MGRSTRRAPPGFGTRIGRRTRLQRGRGRVGIMIAGHVWGVRAVAAAAVRDETLRGAIATARRRTCRGQVRVHQQTARAAVHVTGGVGFHIH